MNDEQLVEQLEPVNPNFEALQRLTKDLKASSRLLGQREVRYLTDMYYQVQKFRTTAANQIRSAIGEPNTLLTWIFKNFKTWEEDIKKALDEFGDQYAVGRWAKSLTGIGPVITAGLLSHLDIRQCKTAGHFQAFAGFDPTKHWDKGQKRPWNSKLKKLLFLLGDCGIKFKNAKNPSVYGQLYQQRKDYEQAKNLRGDYRSTADYILTGICPVCNGTCSDRRLHEMRQRSNICPVCFNRPKVTPRRFGDDTKAIAAYREGRLPDGHIHMRCLRWSVKIFLSHLHTVMYVDYFKTDPPVPYAFAKLLHEDHRHFIPVPNFPWTGGGSSLAKLYERSQPIPLGDASEEDDMMIPDTAVDE